MGKNRKKAQINKTIRLGDKASSISINMFGGTHIDYTGFGYHETGKQRAHNRRANKQQERNVQRGDYD